MANKKTIFQQLGGYLSGEKAPVQVFNGNKELLKTTSKEEAQTAIKQGHQDKYLQSQWEVVENDRVQKAMMYDVTRFASYTDFEAMEFFPEIAAALDIFMEESTTAKNGKILNIHSESSRIASILDDLFYNRLKVNVTMPMWTRNLVKYGDNFLLLNLDSKNGVKDVKQMPNYEMERADGDILYNYRKTGSNATRFIWRERSIEFNEFQVAHFRLFGDDRKLPYGTSILEKCRRIYKQLLLAEDAMLVYRVTRAPERRVYKIYTGNMDAKDIPAYIANIASKFKRANVIDPRTGQIDTKYNQAANDQDYFIPVKDENAASPIETLPGACISLDTRIPLLDGRTLSLNEIIEKWDVGERDLWVYSVNPETGESSPGLITWAGVTRKNADVIKITLDNGEEVITTPDHKFVHREKGFIEAKDLIEGDSLMPFYRKQEKIRNSKSTYDMIWDTQKQKWVYTHRMVSNFLKDTNLCKELVYNEKYQDEDKNTIHHIDNVKEMTESVNLYNHKIVSIEYLSETMDTGTLTIDGDEIYHNHHTFAIESGIYIKNSNLDAISDLEYLQSKLCIALRVPKTFLGFDDAVGEGKNLSLMDVRFSRTINRVQQAMIQELNKIAIVHLYLLGFSEDLNNFKLTLNNPSSAAEMLETEQLQTKAQVFKELVGDAGDGFKVMSRTRALQEIFKWSEEEIAEDLLKQRIEKAAAAELEGTTKIIKYTGVFDKVDRIYGDLEAAKSGKGIGSEEDGSDGDFGGGGGGGFGGGSDFGDLDGEFDDEGVDDTGEDFGEDFGGGDDGGVEEDIETAFDELNEQRKLIKESINKTKSRYKKNVSERKTKYFDNLNKSLLKEEKIENKDKYVQNLLDESLDKLNEFLK